MTTEGLPFPTREEIIETLSFMLDRRAAEEIADGLIEGHRLGKIMWNGEYMVMVPETPNS